MNWLIPLEIGFTQGLLFSGVVMALAIAFRMFQFPDLTVECSILMGGAGYASAIRGDWPFVGAIMIGLLGGAVAGGITGWIHRKLSVNKFLAGILMIAIGYSASLSIMGSSNIGLLTYPDLFSLLEPADQWLKVGNLRLATPLALATLAIGSGWLAILLLRSRTGARMRAAGENPAFAENIGIPVDRSLIVALVLTNTLSAGAGVLLAMHQGFADVGMGQGALILALASMTLGERLLPSSRLPFPVFVVAASIAGSIVYQVLVAYAIRMGLNPTHLKLITALLVLAILAVRRKQYEPLLA